MWVPLLKPPSQDGCPILSPASSQVPTGTRSFAAHVHVENHPTGAFKSVVVHVDDHLAVFAAQHPAAGDGSAPNRPPGSSPVRRPREQSRAPPTRYSSAQPPCGPPVRYQVSPLLPGQHHLGLGQAGRDEGLDGVLEGIAEKSAINGGKAAIPARPVLPKPVEWCSGRERLARQWYRRLARVQSGASTRRQSPVSASQLASQP